MRVSRPLSLVGSQMRIYKRLCRLMAHCLSDLLSIQGLLPGLVLRHQLRVLRQVWRKCFSRQPVSVVNYLAVAVCQRVALAGPVGLGPVLAKPHSFSQAVQTRSGPSNSVSTRLLAFALMPIACILENRQGIAPCTSGLQPEPVTCSVAVQMVRWMGLAPIQSGSRPEMLLLHHAPVEPHRILAIRLLVYETRLRAYVGQMVGAAGTAPATLSV